MVKDRGILLPLIALMSSLLIVTTAHILSPEIHKEQFPVPDQVSLGLKETSIYTNKATLRVYIVMAWLISLKEETHFDLIYSPMLLALILYTYSLKLARETL